MQKPSPDSVDSSPGAAWARLVQFQLRTPTEGLPRWGVESMTLELDRFAARCLDLERDDSVRDGWQAVAQALIDSACAQPLVALQPGLMLTEPPDGVLSAGPLLHDVAALLRDGPRDETEELDLAVRWWEQARSAGLPVEPDFGECWRALEWQGLHRHLSLLGRCHDDRKRSDPKPDPLLLQHWWLQVHKVGLRYGPLRRLPRLIEHLSGTAVTAGYTF